MGRRRAANRRSPVGQTRSFGDVGSMSGLPESGPPNLTTIPSPALRECRHRGLARRPSPLRRCLTEQYSSIASRQAPEHGSTASSPRPDSRISAAAQLMQTPAAEHPAAREVATRLMRCQSEALAHYASTDWKWCACAPVTRLVENAGASQSRSCAK